MKRSKHSLTHFRNTTYNMGELVPICAAEVVRGDTFKHNSSMFKRLSPLVRPIMHPVHVSVHHYFVPMRILWEDWENFITGGEDFDDASVVPTIDFSASPVTAGSLANHMGLPVGFAGQCNAFVFRAYAFIYNKFYRDDQLQDELPFAIDGGDDTTTSTDLVNVNWAKDPFTSARPDDQLGADVTLPLGDKAMIHNPAADNSEIAIYNDVHNDYKHMRTSGTYLYTNNIDNIEANAMYADLAGASSATVNEWRLALATQQWQEKVNISGNQYHQFLRRYGIQYEDSRLSQPEYLAGGKQTIQFSEVLTTAEGDNTVVGDLKGHGIAALRSNDYLKFFPEDGFVISLVSVKPIPMYMQSVPRHFLRRTKEDYYQKELEILPMQEVTNQEVKHDHASPDGTFGYCPKYNELRYIPNSVHGDLANTTEGKSWHLAREFASDPALNSTFVTCNPPTSRIFADSSQPQIVATVQNRIVARRQVSKRAGTVRMAF